MMKILIIAIESKLQHFTVHYLFIHFNLLNKNQVAAAELSLSNY